AFTESSEDSLNAALTCIIKIHAGSGVTTSHAFLWIFWLFAGFTPQPSPFQVEGQIHFTSPFCAFASLREACPNLPVPIDSPKSLRSARRVSASSADNGSPPPPFTLHPSPLPLKHRLRRDFYSKLSPQTTRSRNSHLTPPGAHCT